MIPLALSTEFQDALNLLEKTAQSVFVTGRAGTGKSTLLQLFRRTTQKKLVVLAPTGVAALNVQGQTIHSFFGFPPRLFDKSSIRRRKGKLYQQIDTIIIDEISMVRADLLDAIDAFMRLHRHPLKPFGGVQMIFFGDLFQLPPVVNEEARQYLYQLNYASPYFFDAKVWQELHTELTVFELTKVYRQEERYFIKLLDAIRLNRADADTLDALNERLALPTAAQVPSRGITLTTRNVIADSINTKRLAALSTPAFRYIATVSGNFDSNIYPTEAVLVLKVGAQVMFLRNDPERQYVNGSIGTVTQLKEDEIIVQLAAAQGTHHVSVVQSKWETLRYALNERGELSTEVIGSFEQYPLKLAWAITIHKSQGKTFDEVVIDMGTGAFEHGQTYVALSRCRTLGGIALRQRLRPHDIIVDTRVVDYFEQRLR